MVTKKDFQRAAHQVLLHHWMMYIRNLNNESNMDPHLFLFLLVMQAFGLCTQVFIYVKGCSYIRSLLSPCVVVGVQRTLVG